MEEKFVLQPMLFDEWVAMRKKAGWKTIKGLEAYHGFFKTGGFSLAVKEGGPTCQLD